MLRSGSVSGKERLAHTDGWLKQVVFCVSPKSELDPLLGANTDTKRVLYFGHLGDQIGGFDQFWRGITAGNHYVERRLSGSYLTDFFDDFVNGQ